MLSLPKIKKASDTPLSSDLFVVRDLLHRFLLAAHDYTPGWNYADLLDVSNFRQVPATTAADLIVPFASLSEAALNETGRDWAMARAFAEPGTDGRPDIFRKLEHLKAVRTKEALTDIQAVAGHDQASAWQSGDGQMHLIALSALSASPTLGLIAVWTKADRPRDDIKALGEACITDQVRQRFAAGPIRSPNTLSFQSGHFGNQGFWVRAQDHLQHRNSHQLDLRIATHTSQKGEPIPSEKIHATRPALYLFAKFTAQVTV